MWSIFSVLALVLRSFLKLIGIVILFWLLLSIIQIVAAIPVAAFEQLAGSQVPQAAYDGLCVVLFINLVFLYVRRRRRKR